MAKKRTPKRNSDLAPLIIAFASTLLAMGAAALALSPRLPVADPTIAAPDQSPPMVIAAPAEGAEGELAQRPMGYEQPNPAPVQPQRGRGTLIFVLDDAGHNTGQLEPFLALPFPLTVAVLPGLPWSTAAAEMARAAGKEVILHQPMEAMGGLDPGPGAITTDMEEARIRRIIRDNLYSVPGAVGMNNHMGSRATADERVMAAVLDEARRAGVYFLDSLTIGDSVAHSVASRMDVPAWERSVFLDNSPDRASIAHFVAEGTKVAEKRGYAVMIGHVWSAELAQTLAELYPQLVEQGFSLSTISQIMMEDDNEGFGD